ncbi:hypothetical protein B0H13DRAFT_418062 [Mycena leptocephala]|nr:hypothetical protein B0H13DRAFT_418062 [Mycena leptocephala]
MPNKATNLIAFLRGRIHRTGRAATQKENQRKTANPWGRAKRLTAAIQAVKRIRRALFPFFSHGSKVSAELGSVKRLTAAIQAVKRIRRLPMLGHITASTIPTRMQRFPSYSLEDPTSQRGDSRSARSQSSRAATPAVSATIVDSNSVSMSDVDSPNSTESFGCVIRGGINDPFGYGDPVPGFDDNESSFDDYFDDSEVDNTFSFLQPGVATPPPLLWKPLHSASRPSSTDSAGSVMRPSIGAKMFGGQNEDFEDCAADSC